jgi:hypothetical protein
MAKKKAKKVKKVKKVEEFVEMVLVNAVLYEAERYTEPEYICEMLNVGVPKRELARACCDFALDSTYQLLIRLNNSEQKEVEKRLLKYCKLLV